MSNYHMNMEAMRKFQPEKAQLLDEIFDGYINGLNKPTYNLTTHELSSCITHSNNSTFDSALYVYERNHIIYSCEHKTYANPNVEGSFRIHPGFYIFVEDLDISVLKAIKYEIGNTPYWDWLANKRRQEAAVKTELADLKAKLDTISAIFSK